MNHRVCILSKANDGSLENRPSPLYSRSCLICCADSPLSRSVFAACGHFICRTCALQMYAIMRPHVTCPICRTTGRFADLIEHLSEPVDTRNCGAEEMANIRRETNEYVQSMAAWNAAAASLNTATGALREAQLAVEVAATASRAADETVENTRHALTARSFNGPVTRGLAAALRAAFTAATAESEQAAARLQQARVISEGKYALVQDALAVTTRCREELIRLKRRENERCATLGHRFSRRCGACNTEPSARRVFFSKCSHAVCRACAEKDDYKCPTCGITGNFVPLYEELIVGNHPASDREFNDGSPHFAHSITGLMDTLEAKKPMMTQPCIAKLSDIN